MPYPKILLKNGFSIVAHNAADEQGLRDQGFADHQGNQFPKIVYKTRFVNDDSALAAALEDGWSLSQDPK